MLDIADRQAKLLQLGSNKEQQQQWPTLKLKGRERFASYATGERTKSFVYRWLSLLPGIAHETFGPTRLFLLVGRESRRTTEKIHSALS